MNSYAEMNLMRGLNYGNREGTGEKGSEARYASSKRTGLHK